MMMGKVAVAGVSLILLVGVIVGVVATMSSSGGNDVQKNADGGPSTGMKAVETLCAPADYKDACTKVLTPIATANSSITLEELIQGIFKATLEEVQKVFNVTGKFGDLTEPKQKMALNDCKDLLSFAVDELQSSMSSVGDSQLRTLDDRLGEINSWMSAVISYQYQCLDGLQDSGATPEIKSAMSNGMVNATQLTVNTLRIVQTVVGLVNKFKLPESLTPNPSSRRLLQNEVDKDGYPTWLSSADRKLLAKKGKGGGGVRVAPNAIVAKDGSGQYKTIAAALAAYPKGHKGRYVIYVKAGIYDEYIIVTKEQPNIYMYGDGSRKTIVTGSKNAKAGIGTQETASFSVVGPSFVCQGMGFRNTAGAEGHQAVALRVQSEMSAFINCRIDGYQDTLYAQNHRQFYRNCVISGTIDFIFGDAAVVIQNSKIIVRKPMNGQHNMVTAHGRQEPVQTTAIVIQNCHIVPEEQLFPVRFQSKTYLGRPWKQYARTIVMESELGDLIDPTGWMQWNTDPTDKLYYAEYGNRGPGAKTDQRVKWVGYKGIIGRQEALKWTAGTFLDGHLWLKNSGSKFMLGLKS